MTVGAIEHALSLNVSTQNTLKLIPRLEREQYSPFQFMKRVWNSRASTFSLLPVELVALSLARSSAIQTFLRFSSPSPPSCQEIHFSRTCCCLENGRRDLGIAPWFLAACVQGRNRAGERRMKERETTVSLRSTHCVHRAWKQIQGGLSQYTGCTRICECISNTAKVHWM